MDDDLHGRENLLRLIKEKSNLYLTIHDNTFNLFSMLKEVLAEMSSEINDELDHLDKRIKIEYRDRGKFEAQFQVASDTLLFTMHTNVFEFSRDHVIRQNPYVSNDRRNSHCGMINIYNFLTDSLKHNRSSDEGYLIGRIFINHENRYFVEGKRQISLKHTDFGAQEIDRAALVEIIEAAIGYSLGFDLLVPQFERVKIVSVDQLNTKMENSKIQTGKRLGYVFDSDDV